MKFGHMIRRFSLWVPLALLGLAACVHAISDDLANPTQPPPSPTPAATTPPPIDPTQTPAGQAFTSERFGYTVTIPPGWLFRDRPGEWADFDPLDPRKGTGIDTFAAYLNGRNLALGIGARALPEGSELDAYAETAKALILNGVGKGVCYETNEDEPAPAEPLTLDGQPALLLAYHCPQSYDNFGLVALAINDGKGYWLTWLAPQGNEAEDRAALLQLLDTFSFGE